jgi:hypothetical protein
MRILSGAVVILAGATLFGAGTIARAIASAANKFDSVGADFAQGTGAVVGLIGLVVLATGFRSDSPAKP